VVLRCSAGAALTAAVLLVPALVLASDGVAAGTSLLLLAPLLPFAALSVVSALPGLSGARPSLVLARLVAASATLTLLALAGAGGGLLAHLGIGVIGPRGVAVTDAPALSALMLGLPLAAALAALAANRREQGARSSLVMSAWRLGGTTTALTAACWWGLAVYRPWFQGLDVWRQGVWYGQVGLEALPEPGPLGAAGLAGVALLGVVVAVAGAAGRRQARARDRAALELD
jgi:hypothetical protein